MSTFLQKEIYEVGGSRREFTNQLTRTDSVDLMNQLRLTTPGVLVKLESDNAEYINATPGSHGFPTLKGDWTHLNGIGGGVVCDQQLVVADTSIVENVHFKGSSNPLVVVKSKNTAIDNTVIFRSCVFERTNRPKNPVWVSVEAGAMVVFLGCIFNGGKHPNTNGVVVSNAGAASAVQLAGCISVTGLTFATVTSAGQGNINT